MKSFPWYRKPVSPESYKASMGIPKTDAGQETFNIIIQDSDKHLTHKTVTVPSELLDALHGSKHLTAYTVAADIRKFEIDKYWQRTLYFWGFITAVYAAYFSVLKEFYTDCFGSRTHGTLPLLCLSALGVFFCFSWLLACKGSKHWQENWENHLDLLEDSVTGPLYKTYKTGSYSVSAINIMAGRILSLGAYGLFIFEDVNFVKTILCLQGGIAAAIALVLGIVSAVALAVYAQFVKGNSKASGSIEFETKKYEAVV